MSETADVEKSPRRWRTKEWGEHIKAAITDTAMERNEEHPEYSYHSHFNHRNAENVYWNDEQIVISDVTENPKFSEDFYNCIGCVIVGKTKEGKNISLMAHIYELDDSAQYDLAERIAEFQKRVVQGTVDAVLFGGHYDPRAPEEREIYARNIGSANKLIKNTLGFSPTVISGPVVDEALNVGINVAFDTATRRLWIIRHRQQKERKPMPAYRIAERRRRLTGDDR